MKPSQPDIRCYQADCAKKDEAEGVWQLIHCYNKRSGIAMTIEQIDGKRQHKKCGTINHKIFSQELHDRDPYGCKYENP